MQLRKPQVRWICRAIGWACLVAYIVLLVACLAPFVASAQKAILAPPPVAVDTSTLAKRTDVDAAIATLQAKIPVPADVVPPSEMVGGTAGSSPMFRRYDAANPRVSRGGVATTTDATGSWSITWAMPMAAVPIVLPVAVNTSTQPVVCNVATRTTTGATGRCWYARTLPATIVAVNALVSYDLFGSAASGLAVQVLAIPPTQ